MTATAPNPARLLLERALRTVAWLALAAAIYLASRPVGQRDQPRTVLRWSVADVADSGATALATSLVREVVAAAGDTPPRVVTAELPAVPRARARALLGAVDGADITVQWIDRTQAAGLALSAAAAAGPSGAVDVRVAGAMTASPAALAAVDDLFPVARPLPAPGKRTRAGWTGFFR